MKPCLFILLCLLSIAAKSQGVISGMVADSLQHPVHRASVTYGKVGSKLILGFTQTDENGILIDLDETYL